MENDKSILKKLNSINNESFGFLNDAGQTGSVSWDGITRVSIVTTDKGPFEDDVFLCLYLSDNKRILIPSENSGYTPVYDVVSKFDGFDFSKVIDSMACPYNNEFLCWELH